MSCFTTASGAGMRYGGMRKRSITTSHSTKSPTMKRSGRTIRESTIRRRRWRRVIPARWAIVLPVIADADDLEGIGAAGLAHRLAVGQHDHVAELHLALGEQQVFRRPKHAFAIVALFEIERTH